MISTNPCDKAKQLYKSGSEAAVEISVDDYVEMLEVLPPEYWRGTKFAVGEPYDWDTYYCCWRSDGKYWMKLMPLEEFKKLQPDGQGNYGKPMAAEGLTSYRYKTSTSWMMIGAKNDEDALSEARRGGAKDVDLSHLEIWGGFSYVPVAKEFAP